VSRDVGFDELKRAYYRRAKECHPDRRGGTAASEEEFKQLVAAFDLLSDPRRRKDYDAQLASDDAGEPMVYFPDTGDSIMDTEADDILEEMVVGNEVPRNTTLQTLMLDLTNTRVFILFREAKNRFSSGRIGECHRICRKLISLAPQNILYRYYYAESARKLGKVGRARRHFRVCIREGLFRMPPQRLEKIRARYHALAERQGLAGRILEWILPSAPIAALSEADEMRRQLRKAVGNMQKKHEEKLANRHLRIGRGTRKRRLLRH
jgi:curved DNA-binding protein CbpA